MYTWSDLVPGSDYEVYVFALEGFFGSIQQNVQITGQGSPVTFSQNFNQNDLFINDELGSSTRPLSSYAKTVTADPNRRNACASSTPIGPPPMTAIFFPVLGAQAMGYLRPLCNSRSATKRFN